MTVQPEPKSDNFDQWISYVLTAGMEQAQPSAHVWQRIVRIARSSPVWGIWRKRGNSRKFTTWATWHELNKRHLDMQISGIGGWLLYPRPLLYI